MMSDSRLCGNDGYARGCIKGEGKRLDSGFRRNDVGGARPFDGLRVSGEALWGGWGVALWDCVMW